MSEVNWHVYLALVHTSREVKSFTPWIGDFTIGEKKTELNYTIHNPVGLYKLSSLFYDINKHCELKLLCTHSIGGCEVITWIKLWLNSFSSALVRSIRFRITWAALSTRHRWEWYCWIRNKMTKIYDGYFVPFASCRWSIVINDLNFRSLKLW